MPYVLRNPAGGIESLHVELPRAEAEFLADAHPDVQAFVGNTGPSGFGRLDADFVRVIEDVIDTLIVKNVINITDLPEQAQHKLFARKNFRERVARNALRLFEQPTDLGDII